MGRGTSILGLMPCEKLRAVLGGYREGSAILAVTIGSVIRTRAVSLKLFSPLVESCLVSRVIHSMLDLEQENMPASRCSRFPDHLVASLTLIPEGVFFSEPSFSSFFPVGAGWAKVLKPQIRSLIHLKNREG